MDPIGINQLDQMNYIHSNLVKLNPIGNLDPKHSVDKHVLEKHSLVKHGLDMV